MNYSRHEKSRAAGEELRPKHDLIVDSTNGPTSTWLGLDMLSMAVPEWSNLVAEDSTTQQPKTPMLPNGSYPATSALVPTNEPTQHPKSNQSPQSHPCPHCERAFTRAAILRDHVRTHTAERPFECSVCSKAFVRKNDMRRHEQLHIDARKHICDTCGKWFARLHSLQEHKKGKCGQICSQKIPNNASTRAHRGPSRWTTSMPETPPDHQSVHAPHLVDEKLNSHPAVLAEYMCTLPHPLQFDDNEKFQEHMCKVHEWPLPSAGYLDLGMEHTTQTTCTLPHQLEFSNAQELMDHLTKAHGNPNHDNLVLHSGERCDTGLEPQNGDAKIRALIANNTGFRNHEKYHYCIVCSSRYEQKIPFAKHLLRHLDDIERCPYFCSKCNRSFPMVEHLIWHEGHCTGALPLPEIPYFCERWGCDRVFETKFALDAHYFGGNDGRYCGALYPRTERTVWLNIVKKMRDLSPDSHNQIEPTHTATTRQDEISTWQSMISRW
ncbi:hypothetical protein AOQ84DRAFT_385405 [Glonium stellatum]|uniref:C2H2-type domain-containing protein n=1 Tax=Glonium stellatum TaxID=574774 RepID=A0A8E2FB89_9PEZI|nr:hypothetical protein AOQ84DRAFT_385405 [Glonium stellatum]